jgi:hypothetical protein
MKQNPDLMRQFMNATTNQMSGRGGGDSSGEEQQSGLSKLLGMFSGGNKKGNADSAPPPFQAKSAQQKASDNLDIDALLANITNSHE